VIWYVTLAVTIAVMTPLIRTTATVDLLPDWMQWYLRPSGSLTTFTLFPWAGFVLAGAACGAILAIVENGRSERRVQVLFAAVGAMLVVIGRVLSDRPSIYGAWFWTSPPIWFAMRVGILMIGVAAIAGISDVAARWRLTCVPLERFGRRSLFVYWIHVELVYGFASWPLHGRLPLWSVPVACAAFTALMYGAVVVRDRVVEGWRARPRPQMARETATA
jgi:uncharacterized membrane protein